MRHLVFDSCWVIEILRFYDLKLAEVKKFQVIFAKFWLLSLKIWEVTISKSYPALRHKTYRNIWIQKKKIALSEAKFGCWHLEGCWLSSIYWSDFGPEWGWKYDFSIVSLFTQILANILFLLFSIRHFGTVVLTTDWHCHLATGTGNLGTTEWNIKTLSKSQLILVKNNERNNYGNHKTFKYHFDTPGVIELGLKRAER